MTRTGLYCKSNISSVLLEQGVTVMLAGGIGCDAFNILNSVGIQVVRGCYGNSTEVVVLYLAGKISDSGENCAQHKQYNGEGGHVYNH